MKQKLYRCAIMAAAFAGSLIAARSQIRDGLDARPPAPPPVSQPHSSGLTQRMWPNWRSGTSISFSLAQGIISNGIEGDNHYLAFKAGSTSCEEYRTGSLIFRNMMSTRLGASYVDDSLGLDPVRIGDNEVFDEVSILLPLTWRVDPYISANIRTAVTETFRYSGVNRTRVASLWDPVISQQSAGFTFAMTGESGYLNSRLGVALQQVRARHNTLQTDDWRTKGIVETYRAQAGIEFVNDMMYRFDSTARYVGRFGMLGDFNTPTRWTVRFENQLRFRLWRFIGVELLCNIFCDPRVSPRTQIRQSLTLGVIYDF